MQKSILSKRLGLRGLKTWEWEHHTQWKWTLWEQRKNIFHHSNHYSTEEPFTTSVKQSHVVLIALSIVNNTEITEVKPLLQVW